jgi:hypothetical protein
MRGEGKFEVVAEEEKDFLDQLIDRALGNVTIVRTPYGYMMSTEAQSDPWKRRTLAPAIR